VVTCTHPAEGAEALARELVDRRLAACVQVLPGIRSSYRWEGLVETADEVRLDAKTTAECLDALIAAMRERHPYDVPEIVATPVIGGNPDYLDWIRREVTAP
jgi:periplasmic divalent cation tolerance protein